MKCLWAIALAITLCGCWAKGGQTLKLEGSKPDFISPPRELAQATRVYGVVPLRQVVAELRRMELLDYFPPDEIPAEVTVSVDQTMRAIDLINAVEVRLAWVYDPARKSFYRAVASHSVDGPDAFGRPTVQARAPLDRRPILLIGLRFRRISGGLSDKGANAGANETTFFASIPDGVVSRWESVQERTYYEGVRDPASDGGQARQVETSLKARESGLMVSALAARLPGGAFRIDGTLEISAFTGKGLERARVSLPLNIDAPRGMWVQTALIRGWDIGADAAFRHFGGSLAGTADALELQIRVD